MMFNRSFADGTDRFFDDICTRSLFSPVLGLQVLFQSCSIRHVAMLQDPTLRSRERCAIIADFEPEWAQRGC